MYLGYFLLSVPPKALIQPQWKLPALLAGCVEQGAAEGPAQQ